MENSLDLILSAATSKINSHSMEVLYHSRMVHFFFFLIAWPSCVLWRKSIVSDSRRQGRIRRLHDASGLLFCTSRFICLLPLRFLLTSESLLNSLQWWAKGCDLFSFSKCLKWLDRAFWFHLHSGTCCITSREVTLYVVTS